MTRMMQAMLLGSVLLSGAALAQSTGPFTNGGSTIKVGSVQLNAVDNCPNATTCSSQQTIGIGTGFTDVDVFISGFSVNATETSTGALISRFHVEVRKDSYNSGTGALIVTQLATIDNRNGSDFEFQVRLTYVAATRPSSQQLLKLTDVNTTCNNGQTDTGCSTSATKSNVVGSNFVFVGFAPKKIDISTDNGDYLEVGSIFAKSQYGTVTTNDADHSINCGLIGSDTVNQDCSISALAISRYTGNGDILDVSGTTGVHVAYDVTSTSSSAYSSTETSNANSEVAGVFAYPDRFSLVRDGYNGAALYGNVKTVQVNCYQAGYTDNTSPTADVYSIPYVSKFTDQDSSPWLWYNADQYCRIVGLKD